jgi:cell division protein FtsL
MYFSINSIPRFKNLTGRDKRNLKLKIFKEISFGGKVATTLITAVILSVAAGLLFSKMGIQSTTLEILIYLAFGISSYLGYLYILNVFFVPKTKDF